MFRTSCSNYASEVVGNEGWRSGRGKIAARLGRCDGSYTLSEFDGRLTMQLSDGTSLEEHEISEGLVARYRATRPRLHSFE